jgi:hypothetical protein
MADTITLVGSGGVEWEFDLPLKPAYLDQYQKGQLTAKSDDDRKAVDKTLQPAEGEPVTGPYPGGSVKAVLNWVGDDPDRAVEAFTAESESEKPRKSLVAALEALIDEA